MNEDYHNIQKIKDRIDRILRGEDLNFGDFLPYKSKRTAKKIATALKKEGINCHTEESKYTHKGFDIIFTDISKLLNNNYD